jgi:L,D-transpeptidase catalytic domain/Putative peptidoglycan binding domain
MEEKNKDMEEQMENLEEQHNIVEEKNNNGEQKEIRMDGVDKGNEEQVVRMDKQSDIQEEYNKYIEPEVNKVEEPDNSIEDKNDNIEENNGIEENNNAEKELKKRKIIKWSIISFSSLLIIYFSIAAYFMNRFYFGSAINTVNVAGKTVEEVNKEMESEAEEYKLVLELRDGIKEEIRAVDIGLKYNAHDKVKEIKDNQNPYKWIYGLFNKTDSQLSKITSYDEKLLKEHLDKLSFFDTNKIIEPKNPSFQYTNKGYEIIKQVDGNKVNKDILYENIVNAILKEETTINLEAINCYEKPQYTSESKEVIDAKNTLNKYISSTITYNLGEGKDVLNGSKINTWISIDDKYQITIDELQVRKYVDTLISSYNTVGKTRNFTSTSRGIVKVSGGNYGRMINKSKEVQDLIAAIKEGKTMTKEPIYAQTALSNGANDIGNTYVEIDLTNQYMWFYKNGALITQGNVVTGDISSNMGTPQGTYKLTYKQKNAVLRGPGYAAPVSFWMPFNGDIGIHDATWRSTFGGNIYKTDGSHGCVNSPYSVAEAIFYNIEAGIPVVCYF